MSAISEFADKQNIHNSKISTGLDGIASDLVGLKDLITQLQNSQGQLTPEDQAILDALELKAAALADRVTALDELTAPVLPSTPE